MQIRNRIYTVLFSRLAVVMVMGMTMSHAAAQVSPFPEPYTRPMPPSMQGPYAPYGATFPPGYYSPPDYYPPPGYGQPRGYPPAGNGNWFGGNNAPWSGNWSSSDLPWPGNEQYWGRGGTTMPWQGWHKSRYPWNREENYEMLPWNWNINNGPWNGWAERHRTFKNRKYDSGGSSIDIQ